MKSNESKPDQNAHGAFDAVNLQEQDRILAAARLARSEYVVDLAFAAAIALTTALVSVAARVRHGMTSGKSWFAH